MKRIFCLLLVLSLLMGLAPSASAREEKDGEIPDVTQYSYTVTPILSPFTYLIYVKTDNPDPTSFRLVDQSSKYYTEDSCGIIRMQTSATNTSYVEVDPGTYYISQALYPDVAFEDERTYRVAGGYIFRADRAYSDGGELVLLQKTASGSSILNDRFTETDQRIPCQRLYTMQDYLLTYLTSEEKTLFENLDAVQAFLDAVSVYPRAVYDSSKPIEEHPYPFLASSPYPELHLNEHYSIFETVWCGLLASHAFPFVLDSAGFPGTIRQVALALEPTCEIGAADNHWSIKVTFDGQSRTYGGAGEGGYEPLFTQRVKKSFTFKGEEGDYGTDSTIEAVSTLLKSYAAPAEEDAAVYQDLIAGKTFHETIAETGGTWIRIAVEGGFRYGTSFGYSVPLGEKSWNLSDVWVDGRYVGKHERVEIGATFEEHPLADIVLKDVTFTDYKGVTHTQDVCFSYNDYEDNWNARYFYFGQFRISHDPIPEDLILTHEDVAALDLDYNTNTWPTEGLVYDGTEYPGTPFTHRSVEQLLVPEAMTIRVGEKAQIDYEILPEEAFDHYIFLSSSDPAVVEIPLSVSNDYILGVKEGTAVITVTTRDGALSATIPVTVLPAPCTGEDCPSDIFTDAPAPNHWAHEGIDFAIENGLFNGMSATTFAPETPMTRAMLVTVLWRYAGSPKEGENRFTDVKDGLWYTEAVSWAAEKGIVGGVGNHCFDPDGMITREQLATILYRYSKSIELDTTAQVDLNPFPDSAAVSPWAEAALSWAVAEGLINGLQDGDKSYLDPLGSATRAQVATILMRYIRSQATQN